MPIYEYECGECGHQFELFQKINAKKKANCEKCGGKSEKIISQSSFALKGGGWYADAYSGPSNKKTEKKDKSPKASEPKSKEGN